MVFKIPAYHSKNLYDWGIMRQTTFTEDTLLKEMAHKGASRKQACSWASFLESDMECVVDVDSVGTRTASDIAESMGQAMADLAELRSQENVFDAANVALLRSACRAVMGTLQRRIERNGHAKISVSELNLLIEDALVQHDAHDVARSFVFRNARLYQMPSIPDGSTIKLIRRNGKVVPWNAAKIETAVRKAFLGQHMHPQPAASIVAQNVTRRLQEAGQAFVNIEDVQDKVQEELMRQGFFKIAEAYILYRAQRTQQRASESQKTPSDAQQQASMILVKPEKGEPFLWDGGELRARMEFAKVGLEVDLVALEHALRDGVEPETTPQALKSKILSNAQGMIVRGPDYDAFSARLRLSYYYEEVLGWDIQKDGLNNLKSAHCQHFKNYVRRAVKLGRLSKALLEYDLDVLAAALDCSADLNLDTRAVAAIYEQYALNDGGVLEVPQYFFMRVAMGLFLNEKKSREDWVIRFYHLLKNQLFCLSDAIFRHAGTVTPALASSYTYCIEDSLDSIMTRGIAENAFITKWGGKLSGSWTAVRGANSHIQGINAKADGVLPFLKLHNAQLLAVHQEGREVGQGCAYLELWHSDIFEYQELHRTSIGADKKLSQLKTANWIPDLFMQRVVAKEYWSLFHAHDVVDLVSLSGKAFETRYLAYEKMAEEGQIWTRRVPALELWRHILTCNFETGYPTLAFKDACNIRNMQCDKPIKAVGYWGDTILGCGKDETASSVAGYLVLPSHMNADGVDNAKINDTLFVAVRALDNAVELSTYPTQASDIYARRHRSLAIGLLGLQDGLYMRKLPYASAEALHFNDTVFEALAYGTILASSTLACERGTYEKYADSLWAKDILPHETLSLLSQSRNTEDTGIAKTLDWNVVKESVRKHGVRHAHLLALTQANEVAPLVAVTPGVVPVTSNWMQVSTQYGTFTRITPALVKAIDNLGLWNATLSEQVRYFEGDLTHIDELPVELKNCFKIAIQVDVNSQLGAAARRQKWLDQAQTLDLYLPFPDLRTLSEVFITAWKWGIKTTRELSMLAPTALPEKQER